MDIFEIPRFTIYSLWMILVPAIAAAFGIMATGDRLRGTKIEDVDHVNVRTSVVGGPPVLGLLGVCTFTPITPGPLFWVGCLLNLAASSIYVLAVAAFIKARRGVTTVGIYRVSRNPMYVALFLLFAGFSLMAWSASALTGLMSTGVLVWCVGTTHWMVLSEERFLEGKYGAGYLTYRKSAPRYLLFI